jgi:hypothetical protein
MAYRTAQTHDGRRAAATGERERLSRKKSPGSVGTRKGCGPKSQEGPRSRGSRLARIVQKPVADTTGFREEPLKWPAGT